MSRVLLIAPSRLALASVEAVLGDEPQVTVVARATHLEALSRSALDAGTNVAIVAVDDLAPLRSVLGTRDDEVVALPIVLLVPPDELTDAVSLLLSGPVRAVLPRHVSGRELLAAVESAASGLVTLTPEALEMLTRSGARVPVRLPTPPGLIPLSPREREILALVADGLGNKIVAARLGISEHTVKTHVTSIFTKLGAESRAEAVAIGARIGALML